MLTIWLAITVIAIIIEILIINCFLYFESICITIPPLDYIITYFNDLYLKV